VCIVGAGIAGLSTAYQCVRAGLKVIVLDDGPIGGGETSRTTAHLSNAYDDRYHNLERVLGADAARLVAASHTKAIDEIERIVQVERIDCAFERVDGYLFSPDREGEKELELEIGAALRAGLADVSWVERAPFPSFDTGRCLLWPRQAQFHPMRYLAALARIVLDAGGAIHTGTHVTRLAGTQVRTREGGPVVDARHVVVATNTPVIDRLTIHTKQAAYRTYVIAGPIEPGIRAARALLGHGRPVPLRAAQGRAAHRRGRGPQDRPGRRPRAGSPPRARGVGARAHSRARDHHAIAGRAR
jgi:glycine/D-amino acid oxidase-like deaminating enzyme